MALFSISLEDAHKFTKNFEYIIMNKLSQGDCIGWGDEEMIVGKIYRQILVSSDKLEIMNVPIETRNGKPLGTIPVMVEIK